ncbi:DUF397 domain-containing protein [Streptomyces sp. NPDC050507]|uniref:DUF397 domain-containing protein n=1 Tax=Streptomyces sp. NPDC050507 TaxID=3365619 RepID=UPI00378B8722
MPSYAACARRPDCPRASWSRAFCSGTYIGLFEAGERRPQIELSRSLDELLGSGEHLQRLCRLARTSKVAGYFADAAELQLQVADNVPGIVPVRDSKAAPEGPALAFARERWAPFVAALGDGSL